MTAEVLTFVPDLVAETPPDRCSFCNVPRYLAKHKFLIQSPENVFICVDCVMSLNKLLAEECDEFPDQCA